MNMSIIKDTNVQSIDQESDDQRLKRRIVSDNPPNVAYCKMHKYRFDYTNVQQLDETKCELRY